MPLMNAMKSNKQMTRRRGAVLIYVVVLLTLLTAHLHLGGGLRAFLLIKSEMQRTADVTVRGYMKRSTA